MLWGFQDNYKTAIEAKRAAVKAYTKDKVKGATIRKSKTGVYTVLLWQIGD